MISRADFDAGFDAGLQEAWERVNRWIESGSLSYERNAQRNGMVLAANLILNPQGLDCSGAPKKRVAEQPLHS